MRKRLTYKKIPKAQVGVSDVTGGSVPGMGGGYSEPGGPGSQGPPPEKTKNSGVSAGAITGAFSTAVGMAQPFIEDWDNKRAKKKMDKGYADRGLMNDKEFKKYGKDTAMAINAIENKSYGNLYGAMKTGGILYKIAKKGSSTTSSYKTKLAKKAEALGGTPSQRRLKKKENKDYEKNLKKKRKGRRLIQGPKGGF